MERDAKRDWLIIWHDWRGKETELRLHKLTEAEAKESAKRRGWTEPKFWQWWRWSDVFAEI